LQAPAPAALVEKHEPTPARPPRAATGEATWLASQHFFGSDTGSQLALKVARNACLDQNDRKPAIIMGPTGVGKTHLAHLIHKSGPRGTSGKPYVVVDCATITESLFDSELAGATRGAYTGAVANRKGLLEAADGGTVLFDEIAEISPELQARILRFLQNGEIRPLGSTNPRKLDIRVIAATNKDLAAFRPDLWARLSQGNLVISIPPLDAHWWDIPDYVDGLLERFGTGLCVSDQSLEILTACSWKNNFRSLGCLNENGVALGLLGGISGSAPGSIVTPQLLLSAVGSEPDTQRELTRASEALGIVLPPPEKPDALFSEGMDAWFAKADSRRAWEFILDTVFNRLRGPYNENFLLASRDAKRLGVSTEELSLALGLSGRDAVLKSLRESKVLLLPDGVRERELSDSVARRYRRQLIVFAKRTQFIGLSHDELADVCGVNRTKYYNFYRYAFKLAEGMYANGVTPPMSRYVIDHRGEAERSDRRPTFADENFEKKAGQMTESFAALRKLQLMPGRARSG
jgi:transcriptional regulator with AAA-type ATPase domain